MSVVVAQRLGSCGAQAYLSHRLEFDPVSHALVGGFLTVGPPGKSEIFRCSDSIPLSVLAYVSMLPSLKY